MKRRLKRYPVNGTSWFGPEAFDLFKAEKAFIPIWKPKPDPRSANP
jgi:hypothetical protein